MNITTVKRRALKNTVTEVPMTKDCYGECAYIDGKYHFRLFLKTGDVLYVSQRDFSKNMRAAEELKEMAKDKPEE